jgi:hypothetical protein
MRFGRSIRDLVATLHITSEVQLKHADDLIDDREPTNLTPASKKSANILVLAAR